MLHELTLLTKEARRLSLSIMNRINVMNATNWYQHISKEAKNTLSTTNLRVQHRKVTAIIFAEDMAPTSSMHYAGTGYSRR